MRDLISALRTGKVLLMDGAMGTELQRLNHNHVSAVSDHVGSQEIHRAYLDASAEVLLTNTFQTNPRTLAALDLANRHHEIWQAAINVQPAPRFILADVGPIEHLTEEIAASILNDCQGVDGVLLETWSSLDAWRLFAEAPDETNSRLLVSFTFLHDGANGLTTFEGVRPEACAISAQQNGAIAIGANCGKEIDMADMLEIVTRYRTACDLPIFVRPNAGTPTQTADGWVYPRTPKAMAAELPSLLEAGVTMVGGCCGTTPAHIRAFRDVVDTWNRR